jgi:hypothetical protein
MRRRQVNVKQLAATLGLECLTPTVRVDETRDLAAAYSSDLLSDVLAHAPHGGVLVTVQVHLNVVAVAVHAELVAVIFAMGRRPDDVVLQKAIDEDIALFASKETAFDVSGRLYGLGLRGTQE